MPKPGPVQWRFTVDLRPKNRYTVPQIFTLPIIEHELSKASGAKIFANFELSHVYWQLLLHKDSQCSQSFITRDGIYEPSRTLHGNINANAHLHASFVEKYPKSSPQEFFCGFVTCSY